MDYFGCISSKATPPSNTTIWTFVEEMSKVIGAGLAQRIRVVCTNDLREAIRRYSL